MSLGSKPKISGPSEADLKRQKEAEARANAQEEKANMQLSSTARASYGRRTGRRLLIAPGREDQVGALSGSGGGTNI